jgi:transcriptional regulator with XRE-family HTH domain
MQAHAQKPRELASAEWIAAVDEARLRKGWSLEKISEETGVPFASVVYCSRPLPERVVPWARALELDLVQSLEKARCREPTTLGWALLNALMGGKTREDISDETGVARSTLSSILRQPHCPVSDRVVDQLAPVLRLSSVSTEEIKREMAALRRHGGPQRIDVPAREMAVRVRASGMTERTARRLGISLGTLRARAAERERADSENGTTGRRRYRRYIDPKIRVGQARSHKARRENTDASLSEAYRRAGERVARESDITGRLLSGETRTDGFPYKPVSEKTAGRWLRELRLATRR